MHITTTYPVTGTPVSPAYHHGRRADLYRGRYHPRIAMGGERL